uniref:E2 ubiquitin-conjugating enzyme n=2 Tax=Anthurium amnicola TaxID=1678845 RepID=A0A1D1YUM4_9ARAE
MATNENLPPNVIKQLVKELKNLDEAPPEGIKVVVNDDGFSTIFADIEGPAGTPYENGIFRMKLLLSQDFPQSPPKGYFLTKIFHPNIATNGEVCVNTLKKDWNPGLGLRHVLLVIRCLLIEPFPESALNEQAGKMLLENYDEYARHARLYTGIHAHKPKPKFKTPAISESTTALNVNQKALSCDPAALLPPSTLAAASASIVPGVAGIDHCAVAAVLPTSVESTVGASTGRYSKSVPKRGGTVAAKVQVDKKKMDARKKSLKRL